MSKFFDELVEARRNGTTADPSPAPAPALSSESTVKGSLTLFEGGSVYLCNAAGASFPVTTRRTTPPGT